MDIRKKLISFRNNKIKGSLENAEFVLSYKFSKSEQESRHTSYELLTILKEDADVVIEVNSSLFSHTAKSSTDIALQLVEEVKDLGLDYRYRKVAPVGGSSFFERVFNVKKSYAHEVLVYVSRKDWEREGILNVINPHGARYYFFNNSENSENVLDAMYRMTDEEKLDFFKLIVFDIGTLGNIGMNSNFMTYEEIKKLVGL